LLKYIVLQSPFSAYWGIPQLRLLKHCEDTALDLSLLAVVEPLKLAWVNVLKGPGRPHLMQCFIVHPAARLIHRSLKLSGHVGSQLLRLAGLPGPSVKDLADRGIPLVAIRLPIQIGYRSGLFHQIPKSLKTDFFHGPHKMD